MVNSSEPPFTAPPMSATIAMTTVASDASSRIARSIAMAAVGRKNGRVGRPAVTLSASVAPTRSSPIRISTLSRCHRPGRKRQIQASSIPTTRTASSAQPPKLVKSGNVSRRPRASIFSMSVAANGEPLRTMTSPWRIVTRTGWTSAAAAARAVVVSGRLSDEFGTTSGSMSSAASIRSASSSPPAIRPDRRVRVSSTSVSRSSVRSLASRTRAASVRTTAHRAASRPTRVVFAGSDRSSTAVLSRAFLPASEIAAANVVSMPLTRLSKGAAARPRWRSRSRS